MRALTVRQPWAWAIIEGGKDVENRTAAWSYRGQLAIHAGAQRSDRGYDSPLIQAAALDASYFDDDVIRYQALGAVIGIVELVDAHRAHEGCCESEWAEQEYLEAGGKTRRDLAHLVLENPRPLVPIPAKGRLGLWIPDPDLITQINDQLKETR